MLDVTWPLGTALISPFSTLFLAFHPPTRLRFFPCLKSPMIFLPLAQRHQLPFPILTPNILPISNNTSFLREAPLTSSRLG